MAIHSKIIETSFVDKLVRTLEERIGDMKDARQVRASSVLLKLGRTLTPKITENLTIQSTSDSRALLSRLNTSYLGGSYLAEYQLQAQS
jgi:hypothetical protein